MVAAYVKYVRKNTTDPEILRYCDSSEAMIPANLIAICKSNFEIVLKNLGYL